MRRYFILLGLLAFSYSHPIKATKKNTSACPYGTVLFYYTGNSDCITYNDLINTANYKRSLSENDEPCEGTRKICAICAVVANPLSLDPYQYPLFNYAAASNMDLRIYTMNLLNKLNYYASFSNPYIDDSEWGLLYEKEETP